MEYVLTTNALCKHYKNYKALDGLSMHVPKGAIYGFVGKNGAGKTTLIRLICGLQPVSSGEYTLYGVRSTEKGIERIRRRMGAVVETPSLYLGMTARENLKEQYRVLGLPSFEGLEEILELVGLSNVGKKKAKHFSLGMRQRLGIAIALVGDPDFLVLDEPVNGLDPQGIIEIRELILKLNRERQITVLVSSHILGELSKIATCYGFIDRGVLIKEIDAAQLLKECRKCMCLHVSDTKALARVLEGMGVEYAVLSDERADVYGEIEVSTLVMSLNEQGCRVISVKEKEESLESYYMSIVGGGEIA